VIVKKILLIASMALTAAVAFAGTASASTFAWIHEGKPLEKGGETIELDGWIAIDHNGAIYNKCEVHGEAALSNEIEGATADITELTGECEGYSGPYCQIDQQPLDVTLPWQIKVNSPEEFTVSDVKITQHIHGNECLFRKGETAENIGSLQLSPDDPERISSLTVSGYLDSFTGKTAITGDLAVTPAEEYGTEEKTYSAPSATTKAASGVEKTSANLNALVNAKGSATTYQFEYGTTTSYGSKVPVSPKSIGAGEGIEVGEAIGGLQPGTTYHYRVATKNFVGTTYGKDETFKTKIPTWFVEGERVGNGKAEGVDVEGEAWDLTLVSNTANFPVANNCGAEVQGRIWNGTSGAEGEITALALSGGSCSGAYVCEVSEITGNATPEEGWPISVGDTSSAIEIGGITLDVHYASGCFVNEVGLEGSLLGNWDEEAEAIEYDESGALNITSLNGNPEKPWETTTSGELGVWTEAGRLELIDN
jgi:hypothetical protein